MRISKRLERLNPLEPMFILVDYFRVRFPTTDPLTVIKDILHIKPRHMLHVEYGRYGYEEQYILGDITVLVYHRHSCPFRHIAFVCESRRYILHADTFL